MKTIQLTPQEFYIFKMIANFEYKIESIKHTVKLICPLQDVCLHFHYNAPTFLCGCLFLQHIINQSFNTHYL